MELYRNFIGKTTSEIEKMGYTVEYDCVYDDGDYVCSLFFNADRTIAWTGVDFRFI